jgi:hypothetical protein
MGGECAPERALIGVLGQAGDEAAAVSRTDSPVDFLFDGDVVGVQVHIQPVIILLV